MMESSSTELRNLFRANLATGLEVLLPVIPSGILDSKKCSNHIMICSICSNCSSLLPIVDQGRDHRENELIGRNDELILE